MPGHTTIPSYVAIECLISLRPQPLNETPSPSRKEGGDGGGAGAQAFPVREDSTPRRDQIVNHSMNPLPPRGGKAGMGVEPAQMP